MCRRMNNVVVLTVFLGVFVLSLATNLRADVSLPKVFGDNMVLQRDMPVPVWGWAEAGENVAVTFGGQEKRTVAGDDGKWMVKLDAMKANKTPAVMTIKGKNAVTFKNVLVGEVWLCSGQSNMSWGVRGSANAKAEIAKANFPEIRHLAVSSKCDSSLKNDLLCRAWQECSPKTVTGFTAVGYFFGRSLYESLDVPIGLIRSSWGGTRIEPWTCPEGFRMVPELKKLREQIDAWDSTTEIGRKKYAEYVDEMKKWLPKAETALADKSAVPAHPQSPRAGGNHQTPTRIYNAMIHPLIPYAIRGAIWYQGEANGGEGISYFHKMNALIKGWRELWGQGEFPFLFVQLANFRHDDNKPGAGDGWARAREAQMKSLEIPNTGMAVIIDIGEGANIHPKNKQDVGDRLARWALADVYGKNITPSGPLYKSHKVEDGKIRVAFDHVGGGLMVGEKNGLDPVKEVPNGELKRFAVAGKDKKFHWAKAVIDGEAVVVSSSEVPEPVAVRYAYSANPVGCNLYNKDGLPASPFRTDDW